MSLRIALRALLGVALILLVVPVVIALAGELPAADAPLTTLSGLVVEEHGDDFATGTARYFLTLVTDKDRFSLTGPGTAALRPGQHVNVTGVLRGGTIDLASTDSIQVPTKDKLSAGEAAALGYASTSSAAAQVKNVAVLLINFVAPTPSPSPTATPCMTPTPPPTATPTASPAGTPTTAPTVTPAPTPTPTPTTAPATCPPPTPTPTPSPTPAPAYQPWTTTQVAGYYFNNTKSVASFYREVSNGSLTVTGMVYGWYTLTMSTSTCDYNGFATAARAAATAAGVDLTAYTNIVYAFPKVSACSWGGMGNVYGPYSWINGNSAMGVYVPTHELGHNFGSHHASSLTCVNGSGVRVQYSNNCTASEYGDPFDVMGSNASSSGGIHHQNTWAMRQIGVLTTADQQTVTTSGTYFVATAPVGGGVPRIMRIPRPSTSDYYYLEFRQPYGSLYENWDPTLPVVNGVMIRIAPDTKRIQSRLIDCHPETSSFSDAPCLVGDRFVDNINVITIITRSIGPAGAYVYIQVGPDVTPPSAPGSLNAAWTGPSTVSLSWTAATDEIGVTGYQVRRDGTLITTVSGSTLSYDDSAALQTTKYYTVAARDAAGNVGPAETVYVGPPDTTPPGPVGSVSASATTIGEAELTWTAATDDVGVTGYDVSVGGTVVATVNSLDYLATGLTSLESVNFSVAALDAAGNVGPAVDTTFVMPDLVPPGSPSNLATTAVGKTSVALGWTAATDDVGGVGYNVSRDGALLGTTAATSFEDDTAAPATTYSYGVAAVDGAGNVGLTASVSATTVEATPPTVVAPLTTLATSGQLGTSTVPIVVSWSASDASGVASMELQQSKNGGTWSALSLASPTQTSVTLMRVPGNTFAFRVRATDSVGNTSDWATGPTFRLASRQESSTSIAYVGTWTAVTDSTAFGGALKYATSSTATATLTFTGRSVAWVAPLAANRGKADIYVDGVYATTVDLYSATSLPREIAFTRTWSTSGTHTLQIRVKATSGRPRVDVDAFVLIN